VCGAGGGGCILFMVEEGAKEAVSHAVAQAGGRMLSLKVAREGLRVSQRP
jgi:D-glycero-alpha-D-manno-heptose-7-phosphate kinase